MKRISSRHHPLVAACRAEARGAAEEPRLLLDGVHLVTEAQRANLALLAAAFSARALASAEGARLAGALAETGVEVVEAADPVLEAMSPVSTPSGVVALARRPAATLQGALRGSTPLVVIAADVQEPGNVGAIARAAEAGGATGAVFCGATADPFGWKALRGSMGSVLRLPLAHGVSLEEAIAAARLAGLRILAAVPRGGAPPDAVDLRGPVAFLLGGEGPGLPDRAVRSADGCLAIPMREPVESLNVAVAAALLVYEAARQRRTPGVIS